MRSASRAVMVVAAAMAVLTGCGADPPRTVEQPTAPNTPAPFDSPRAVESPPPAEQLAGERQPSSPLRAAGLTIGSYADEGWASPEATAYTVDDSWCPPDHRYGLTISTEVPVEVAHLREVVACTDAAASSTFLMNYGSGVWTLHSTADAPGDVTYGRYGLSAVSFAGSVQASTAVLVPGGSVSIALPPQFTGWHLDLAMSVAWRGHYLVETGIAASGWDAQRTALQYPRTPGGIALAACTKAVQETAEAAGDLSDRDEYQLADLVLQSVGAGASDYRCVNALQRADVVDPATQKTLKLYDRVATPLQHADQFDEFATRFSGIRSLADDALRVVGLLPRVPGP